MLMGHLGESLGAEMKFSLINKHKFGCRAGTCSVTDLRNLNWLKGVK